MHNIFWESHNFWLFMIHFPELQKQPPQVFYQERCSLKFRNIHRKTPVLESLFHKAASLQACNFVKKRFQHRCFPVNIAQFLRIAILKNNCERLLPELLRSIIQEPRNWSEIAKACSEISGCRLEVFQKQPPEVFLKKRCS